MKAFVRGSKSDDPFPYFTPFSPPPRNVYSVARYGHRSNDARGLIVAVVNISTDRCRTDRCSRPTDWC